MRRFPPWMLISILVSTAVRAGDINIGTIFVSGDVVNFESGHETSHRELSRSQLQALSLLLGLHRSDWHGITADASKEPGSFQLILKDNDGKDAFISVIGLADGQYHLRFVSSDKWSYRSFGGVVKYRAATRTFSDKEFVVLQKILGTN